MFGSSISGLVRWLFGRWVPSWQQLIYNKVWFYSHPRHISPPSPADLPTCSMASVVWTGLCMDMVVHGHACACSVICCDHVAQHLAKHLSQFNHCHHVAVTFISRIIPSLLCGSSSQKTLLMRLGTKGKRRMGARGRRGCCIGGKGFGAGWGRDLALLGGVLSVCHVLMHTWPLLGMSPCSVTHEKYYTQL